MTLGQSKFSPTEFAAKMRNELTISNEVSSAEELKVSDAEQFDRLGSEIRTYLSSPRGLTEDERRQYSETLNRAVLGFAQEREQILALIEDRLIRLRIDNVNTSKHPYTNLAEALFAEVVGLNILELVLSNKEGLEEIQVVGVRIYEVRGGIPTLSKYRFDCLREVERIQQNLVLYNNDRINPRKRWAEVMLRDGSRVTMTGFGFTANPTLTIRFYTVSGISLANLCGHPYYTLNNQLLRMLRDVLRARFNIVIIGATNSGKTNLMKALIAEIADEERIVTIEGRFEMMLGRDFPSKNIIEYETSEEDPVHRSSQAFKLALRQSPQRIIHAEIRDEDANIYVRACTRGHSGSMTTVHASHLEDVPEAITDMCMLDGRGMNPERLAKRVAENVTEIGIEMRVMNGRRVITRIGEFGWRSGETYVRDWARFDVDKNDWIYPHLPSERAKARLLQAGGYENE
ncbi:ATPase, T2SS/T4P/T4SS family [Paenibacillus sp. L3-i20]|uniref:ATPase, T2SS/T4P/T4SS family n=1 Tax=Paenibacillus sp. L3-i20 TaxID=2905833 RepID=UPI001EDF781A|nr:ATPase, T2SS/T4P/T4SS family [Paenibacillus sp. L3-i20]GKU76163.1 hypothetical protein L3i20_v205600 [Paenibacillus sp. L3-i20]